MDETIKQLILDTVENESWESVIFSSKISANGSSRPGLYLVDELSNQKYFEPNEVMDLIKISDLATKNFFDFKEDPTRRFNKVEFEVFKDGTYKANYSWDEAEDKDQKLKSAQVFPLWLHERLLQFLFEAGYGDIDHWQKGVLTTLINKNKEIDIEVILSNNEVAFQADPKFPDYVFEAILHHYEITNNGLLGDVFKKWNSLVIQTRRTSVDLEKDVVYSLVD